MPKKKKYTKVVLYSGERGECLRVFGHGVARSHYGNSQPSGEENDGAPNVER